MTEMMNRIKGREPRGARMRNMKVTPAGLRKAARGSSRTRKLVRIATCKTKFHMVMIGGVGVNEDGVDIDDNNGDTDDDDIVVGDGDDKHDDDDNQGNQARQSHHHNLVGRHT